MSSDDSDQKIANLEYKGVISQHPSDPELETYYTENILPAFGVTENPIWERHIKTGPDNFLHLFKVGDTRYALAFDDYPSGFSVEKQTSIKTLKTKDGSEILRVWGLDERYMENVFSYFKLFKVINITEFTSWIGYLENQYKKLQIEWHESSRHIVSVSRDIVRMANVAAVNKDWTTFSSVANLVDTLILLDAVDNEVDLTLLAEYLRAVGDDIDPYYQLLESDYKKQVKEKVYRVLAYNVSARIKEMEYDIKNLGQTITLVTAMYAKASGGTTSGITVSFMYDEKGVFYPREHFINDELKAFLGPSPSFSTLSIENDLPDKLGGYNLVAGSASSRDIFRQELEYISF